MGNTQTFLIESSWFIYLPQSLKRLIGLGLWVKRGWNSAKWNVAESDICPHITLNIQIINYVPYKFNVTEKGKFIALVKFANLICFRGQDWKCARRKWGPWSLVYQPQLSCSSWNYIQSRCRPQFANVKFKKTCWFTVNNLLEVNLPLCQTEYSNVKLCEESEVVLYSPLTSRLDVCNWPVLCPPSLSWTKYSADPTAKNSTPAGKGTLVV